MLKRTLSLVLVLAMLAGYTPPVHAHAQEIENAEVPVAEETIAATEETTAATECPADPTAAATEPATEPETEPATEPTQSSVPEETVAPTEEAEETLQTFEFVLTSEEDFTQEELYEAYAAGLFYGNSFSFFGTAAGEMLTGDEKLLYDELVPQLRKIACGQRASTSISIGRESPGYPVDAEVTFTGTGFAQEQLSRVIDALLADLSFELY